MPIKSYQVNKSINDYKQSDLPFLIEIETVNRCNGICSFCPVNAKAIQRPYAKMSEDVFFSIINQLHSLNYSNTVNLFSNNEPLIDERIGSFAKYAREKLPNAKLVILTNGRLLTIEKCKEILPNIDFLIIDNYNDDFEMNPSVKIVYDWLVDFPEFAKKVTLAMRLENEILTTRGGSSPNKKISKTKKIKCQLPFRQMVIRPDGKVSLCCNDPLGKITLGDVTKQSLTDIWFSDGYKKLRNDMKKNGRKTIELCRGCDFIMPNL